MFKIIEIKKIIEKLEAKILKFIDTMTSLAY